MFPNGVGEYVDLMQDLIPEMKDGTIRTAIDTGCGVSFTDIFIISILLVNSYANYNSQIPSKTISFLFTYKCCFF